VRTGTPKGPLLGKAKTTLANILLKLKSTRVELKAKLVASKI